MIDLRTDALTRPTQEMWEAMQAAHLGWPAVREDPSVNNLEALAADMAGKEAGLFVPTGTVANLVALMTHTKRGDQVLIEATSHILWCEESGLAYISGLIPRTLAGTYGSLDPEMVRSVLQERVFAYKHSSSLLALENTHNFSGGTIISLAQTRSIAEVAKEFDVAVHLDGARIFNACVAIRTDLRTLVAGVDTVTMSLNKGLSAPIGSVLLGPREFIDRARVNLKRVGGASMSKAGIFAAAGIVALKSMVDRLAEDNRRAGMLAHGLHTVEGLQIDEKAVQTNMVVLTTEGHTSSENLVRDLEQSGIRAHVRTNDTVRFTTHRHISDEDIVRVIEVVGALMSTARRAEVPLARSRRNDAR